MWNWTEKRPHINLRFTKTDLKAKVRVDHKIFSPTTGPLAGIGTEIEGIIIIIIEITDPTIETDQRTTIEIMIDEITIKLMKDIITEGEKITGKTVETDKTLEVMTPDRDMEIDVRVGIDLEIIAVIEPEVWIEVKTEMGKFKTDPGLCQMTEEDHDPDLTLE